MFLHGGGGGTTGIPPLSPPTIPALPLIEVFYGEKENLNYFFTK